MRFGAEAEQKIIAYLESVGAKPVRCGQETWLPRWAHEALRSKHGIPEIDAIRHFPDLYTEKNLIQVKSAPDYNGHPYLTIEQASFLVSRILCKNNVPTVIMWYVVIDEKPNILWERADRIEAIEPTKDRHDANGSMTPMFFVRVSNLKRIQL